MEKNTYSMKELLINAIKNGASDLQVTVGVPPVFKIRGEWQYVGEKELEPEDTKRLVRELFPNDETFNAFLAVGDKDFSLSISKMGRFRVNTFIQRGSLAAAIRLVFTELPNPKDLLIPDSVLQLHKLNKGLVLVTGPTGSGKSTTLSCIIDLINSTRKCHILTLEEPIEYLHEHKLSVVNQREIGQDTQSYARALKAALRESPDVILVGEMRDLETISIAMTAAETGHLVLSTLHTLGASKSIDRIIDVFPPNQQHQIRMQLSTVLKAVISQQLIPSEKRGRVAAFEVMCSNNAIQNLIRENKTYQIDSVIHSGKNYGMKSMDNDISELYKEGYITREDALLYSLNPDVLLKYL
ncbi:MAG: type IV pilus twitching motility protein PilT [Clostridiaceae bacterium]|nr:type IV pilus twitching motility protein PilT [Clostridiaceae bacterium]